MWHIALTKCLNMKVFLVAIFYVKGKALREWPSYYILNRWTKMASNKPNFAVDGTILEGCSQMEHEDKLI